MSNENANQPAFPCQMSHIDGKERVYEQQEGLTKLEFFAAMALASGSTPKDAVSKADELLKALNP